MRLALRSVGWLFIAAGALVALYLVYSLYWTGRSTAAAQDRLLEAFAEQLPEFALDVDELEPLTSDDPVADPGTTPVTVPADVGAAVGLMEFVRPGAGPVVTEDPVVVVEGVTVDALKTGPGRYPGTAHPGEDGNFAVAGHRTTYGAPFWDLDQLREGDEIHVTDREGAVWVYEFTESRIVPPADVSVLQADPLGSGAPMLTLTTCHPRWSQRERLIVFAELRADQTPAASTSPTGDAPTEIPGD